MTDDDMPRSAAIVLAGGQSRRMGRDKAWIDVDGEPALARIVRQLIEAELPVVVVARPGQALPVEEGRDRGVRIVHDPADAVGEGPLVGLRAGFEALPEPCDRVFATSCDALAMDVGDVQGLLSRLDEASIQAVVVEDESGRWQPLFAAYRRAPTSAVLTDLVMTGVRRLGALVDALSETGEVRAVPTPSLQQPLGVAPCNTPEQLAAIRDALRRR